MSSASVTYHIVGGGIAGLACAWFLKQRNKNIRTVIYEALSHLGGRAYSYRDDALDCNVDNAVHTIIGANKFMSSFVKKNEWEYTKYFVNPITEEIDTSLYNNRHYLYKACCNICAQELSQQIKQTIWRAAFPYMSKQRKVWFSKQNLTPRIINVLAGYADEIHYNCKLTKILAQFGMAAGLDFGKKIIDIGAHDKVIIALDNVNCSKVLNFPLLEHNQIVNIVYRVSQTVFLPKGSSFIGIKEGICDWIFSNDSMLTAVISDCKLSSKKLSDLAIRVWSEVDKVRGVNSAFMPPYKAFCYKNATIRQDAENNSRRPKNALTEYPNVFIAGDWTIKDYPCCMETAVKSALRAVKAALKSA